MGIRIIEIKAKCDNTQHVRKMLDLRNARRVGMDEQIDTYFKVPKGRLKLRQGNIENSLIQYARPNDAAPKLSEVKLYKPGDVQRLYDTLAGGLAILTQVKKKREIFFIDNIKIHIDEVDRLGHFIEIEAIDENDVFTNAELKMQCQKLMEELLIVDKNLITHSYSDLILQIQNERD